MTFPRQQRGSLARLPIVLCATSTRVSWKAFSFTFQRELRRAEFASGMPPMWARTGEMFFGSNDGLTVFHPNDIVPNSIPPVLAFTEFRVRNEPLPLQARMNCRRYGRKASPRSCCRRESRCSPLEFAALHFAAPDQNQYAYRLVNRPGVERDRQSAQRHLLCSAARQLRAFGARLELRR